MKYNIKALNVVFTEILNRKLILPDFQRDFVWKRDQQGKLIASLMNDLPSGSFMTSQMPQSLTCRDCGLKNDYFNSIPNAILLLDGQQRLTTLFNAFNNIYDCYNTHTPNDIFDKYVFSALKVRWFLSIDIENEDVLGLKYFNKTDDIPTSEFENALVKKNDIKTNTNGYGLEINVAKLIEFCKTNKLIPLFLLNERKYPVGNLQRSGFEIVRNLLRWFSNDRYSTLSIGSEEDLKSIADHYQLDYQNDLNILNDLLISDAGPKLLEDWRQTWLSQVTGYFDQLLTKNQMFLEIEQHSKVIDAFEYLNKAGTRLTTFDLFCAKFSNLGLRQTLIELIQNDSVEIIKDNVLKTLFYRDLSIVSENEIDVHYANLYMQTVAMCYFHEHNSGRRELTTGVLKSDFIFTEVNDIDRDFVIRAARVMNNAIAFFQLNFGFQGMADLPNKLSILPLIWVSIQKNASFLNNKDNDIVRAHYYVSIFTGKFDSHQNINSVNESVNLVKLINRDNIVQRTYFERIDSIFNDTGFLNFPKLANQSREIISASIEINILNFILCKNDIGLVDFDDIINPPYNHINSTVRNTRNIHHIVPLNMATSFFQSTREIRRYDYHRLNSVLNKTLISEHSNKSVIGSKAVSLYFNLFQRKLPSVCSDHIIPNSYANLLISNQIPLEYNSANAEHQKIDAEYMLRFNLIKNEFIRLMTFWLDF
jgi:hypothetical protein